jgi:hypothetical protein
MAQVMDCLPSKREALSSNPGTEKTVSVLHCLDICVHNMPKNSKDQKQGFLFMNLLFKPIQKNICVSLLSISPAIIEAANLS